MIDRLRLFIANTIGFKTKEVDSKILDSKQQYKLTENNYLAALKSAVDKEFPNYVEVRYAKRRNPELAPMTVRIVVETR